MDDFQNRLWHTMENNKNFEIGQEVWIVEREFGEAVGVSCVLFLAKSKGCIIASAWINDYDFDEIINYHIEKTADNFDTDLKVYPIEDCFATREEAERRRKSVRGCG